MESLEDNARVDVKTLVSAFKELSGMPAGSRDKGKSEKTESSSKDIPLHFRKNFDKTPWSKTEHYSDCPSESSSKDIPLHFRKDHKNTQPWCSSKDIPLHFRREKSINLPCPSSSKDIPLHFKEKQWERPDADSECKTDSSLKDNKINIYGMPQHWGGHVTNTRGAPKLNIMYPPVAVYPVLRTDQRAPDEYSRQAGPEADYFDHKTESSSADNKTLIQDNSKKAESTKSSTSGYSSAKTVGSRDSQSDEETVIYDNLQVICEICQEAPAVKTCLTCNVSFCEPDGRQHYKVDALNRHIFIDVCEEVERKRCLHYEKSLDFFCRTDQMSICSICVQRKHRGHDIIEQRAWRTQRAFSDDKEHEDHELPHKVVPPPGKIQVLSVKPNSVVLKWGDLQGLEGPKSFRVMWSSSAKVGGSLVIRDFHKIEINHLELGQKYSFSVATEDEDGSLSKWVTTTVFTDVPPPRCLTKEHLEATAVSLKWMDGDNMEGIPHQFLIAVKSPGKEPLAVYTDAYYKKISDLQPDTKYTISVSTVLNDRCSESVSVSIYTEPCLREVLSKIGFEDQYDTKLTLSTVLEINQYDISHRKPETPKALPEAFLKRLMSLNTNARSVTCLSYDEDTDKSNAINPLDLITALFLCSDCHLQQELVLKMSLCQFAVPLLLPNSETREIIMMLWSMRGIVRTFRPSQQAFRKSYCEERLVLSDIPFISFVRLGKISLSKSQMLNKLLSNTHRIHDTFYHRNMTCGDVPRRISDGLVEISWYLPCGTRNIDKFTEPLTVANLRGDIRAFDKQFLFLCQASAAVYIFCDESESDYFKSLEEKHLKAKIFLISSTHGKTYGLKILTVKPSLKMTDVIQKKKTDTELLKALQESVSKMLESHPAQVSVANLADTARRCQILVDEDSDECQSAWKNVCKITSHVTNTSQFKDQQLPSQGNIWKAISWVETEYWRLRKVGTQNPDHYCKSLKPKEEELRRKQQRFEVTAAMVNFHHGATTSEVQRYYFLKWLEIELDNLTRTQLSDLQDQYKDLRQKSPQEKEQIVETDKQISVCSLRVDHFLRECGQLYNTVSYLPEHSRHRKNIEQLPAVCAQMLLDGFPLELVDGDATNIPMKWISQVLTELHNIMYSNSKLKVIAVIGAENSGKSTLVNTMFGVRFAVSKGTCTRGVFMQLISVSKGVRKELGCDCIMIIDTEGLKPHQMVQVDHSHERDKEVASLAVALSDAAIVSISKDSSREKDILEMVLHAFTRLKDVSKKPLCHFVHTNMSDMSVVECLKRDKELMEQLNEMIWKDSKMKKANITMISDVIKFDPNSWSWYIPPVWEGTPPMAPVNVSHSATVDALKKSLIRDLKKCPGRGDLMQFIEKIERFWKAL